MKTFSDTQPKKPDLEPENDRPSLADGMLIGITRIEITDKTQFKLLARVDGFYLVNKQPGKWKTFAGVLLKGLINAKEKIGTDKDGNLKESFSVKVCKPKGKSYLVFEDAPA